MKLSKVLNNPNNPRIIRDGKFEKLKASIKKFPKMMALRPMVVDENMILLGGNMRRKALEELGYTEIPDDWVKKATDLSDEEIREFIILDNVPFGEWDYEMLANQYEPAELESLGLTIQNYETLDLEGYFEEHESQKEKLHKISFEYNEETYTKVLEKLNEMDGTNEEILLKLLKL